MATSLLLMATDQTSGTQETSRIMNAGSDETKPEGMKTRGRKSSVKSQNQKKIPQRGMGVEKLERLRLQEWGKQLEITNLDGLSFPNPVNNTASPMPPFSYPNAAVPMLHPPSSFAGSAMIGSAGFLRVNPSGLVGPRGGFCGGSLQVMMDPSRVTRVHMESDFETSKELTSIPKPQECVLGRCDACFKKVRSDDIWCGKDGEIPPANIGCEFLGLEQTRSHCFKNELNVLAGKPPASPTRNRDESVEVLAIHRKWNSQDGGGIVMEYEFFPAGKDGRRTYPNGQDLPEVSASAPVAVGAEVSYSTVTAAPDYRPNTSDNSCNNIDLSLKL